MSINSTSPYNTYNKVILSSGHLTDNPDRPKPRFPESKVGVVSHRIAHQLETWKVGPGDLAICGGARGSDILFAEFCASRGADVWLFISLEEKDFIEQALWAVNIDWEQRLANLRKQKRVKTFFQNDRSHPSPFTQTSSLAQTSPFAQANSWMIHTGLQEAPSADQLYALLVWDELPSGDGPGGTADFAAQLQHSGAQVAIINPVKIPDIPILRKLLASTPYLIATVLLLGTWQKFYTEEYVASAVHYLTLALMIANGVLFLIRFKPALLMTGTILFFSSFSLLSFFTYKHSFLTIFGLTIPFEGWSFLLFLLYLLLNFDILINWKLDYRRR